VASARGSLRCRPLLRGEGTLPVVLVLPPDLVAEIGHPCSSRINVTALVTGLAILALMAVARRLRVRVSVVHLALGIAAWIALFKSGVDPVTVGLVVGVLTLAYPAARSDLEEASESFRLFREQPTPELASQARESVRTALSPNERLQQMFHPWSSYLIVPLFALANAGIVISGSFLAPRLQLAGDAGHPDRLRGRQAHRHHRRRQVHRRRQLKVASAAVRRVEQDMLASLDAGEQDQRRRLLTACVAALTEPPDSSAPTAGSGHLAQAATGLVARGC
jgi:Na+/H+ antiporter 1